MTSPSRRALKISMGAILLAAPLNCASAVPSSNLGTAAPRGTVAAGDVVAGRLAGIGIEATKDQQRCVADRVIADTRNHTLGTTDEPPTAEDYVTMVRAALDCGVPKDVFADEFERSLAQQVSAERRVCLYQAFQALSVEQIGALITAGGSPLAQATASALGAQCAIDSSSVGISPATAETG